MNIEKAYIKPLIFWEMGMQKKEQRMKRVVIELPEGNDDVLAITAIGVNNNVSNMHASTYIADLANGTHLIDDGKKWIQKKEEYVPDICVGNNGWIPCSERLPENNNVVLCWVKSTTIASGETFIIGSCDRGFWFLQTYEIGHHHFPVKDYEVVAWCELPEPYKEESEEQE